MTTIRKIPGKNPFTGLFPKKLSPDAAAVAKKLSITNRLLQLMQQQKVSRTELATRMGVQPSRITAMLSGTSNLTIDTLVRAGHAIGMDLHQTYAPEGRRVVWTSYEAITDDSDIVATLHVPFRLKESAENWSRDYIETFSADLDPTNFMTENVA